MRPHSDCAWLWAAFGTLGARRLRIHGVPQPIPLTEIAAYANFMGYRDEVRQSLLFHIVLALDEVYLTHKQNQ